MPLLHFPSCAGAGVPKETKKALPLRSLLTQQQRACAAALPWGLTMHQPCLARALFPLLPASQSLPALPHSITRNDLGPHKSVVITIPLIFFITSLVVDYVLYAARGFDAFNTDTAYDPSTAEPGEEDVGAFTGLVFFICIVANMMAFMLVSPRTLLGFERWYGLGVQRLHGV